MIDEILKFNEQFVAKELYKPYVTTKYTPPLPVSVIALKLTVELSGAEFGDA